MPRELSRGPKGLRKREIAFAVAMGLMGAGGAALVLNDDVGPRDSPAEAPAQNKTYALADFDGVSIAGPQDVDIVFGEDFSVSASGSAEALRQLEAVVEDGTLVIRPREGQFFGNWDDLDDVTFTVTMPAVNRIDLAGSGDVTVDRVTADGFAGLIGGPGTMVIDRIETGEATFTVNGSGDLDASGTVGHVTVTIDGSGAVHAQGLTSTRATIAINGSGEVELTAVDQADVSITGSGDVDISGPAICSVTRTGGGDVRCEGDGDGGDD